MIRWNYESLLTEKKNRNYKALIGLGSIPTVYLELLFKKKKFKGFDCQNSRFAGKFTFFIDIDLMM